MTQRLFDELLAGADAGAGPVIDRLAASASTVRARRNELIYEQGDPNEGIHLVAHGAVLLEWHRRNGVAVAFRLAVGGDNFGARSFCADEQHAAKARALREALVLHVPRPALLTALRQAPSLWRPLARVVARDVGPQLTKVLRNPHTPARARLAYLLAYLESRLPGRVAQPVGHPDSPLRQRDLAHLLDVTDETISRAVTALEGDGLIRHEAGTGGLEIPDSDRLEREFEAYV